MKDKDGREVHLGDIVLVPLEGECGYDEQIMVEVQVVPAILYPDESLKPYVEENVKFFLTSP